MRSNLREGILFYLLFPVFVLDDGGIDNDRLGIPVILVLLTNSTFLGLFPPVSLVSTYVLLLLLFSISFEEQRRRHNLQNK